MSIKNRIAWLITLTTLSISISLGTLPAGQAQAQTIQSKRSNAQKVIQAGKRYMGIPYEFGSNRNSTRTLDCSDFTRRAFINGSNITLPTNSRTQAQYILKKGKPTSRLTSLKPGDLMFFMSYKGPNANAYTQLNKQKQRITHVAIYLGNGEVLHTYSKASGGVRTDNIIGKHWQHRFIFGGSVQ